MRPRSIKISSADLERRYLVDRADVREIAASLQTSESTIYNRLRELGLTRPLSEIDMQSVNKLYVDDGMKVCDIAKMLGYSRTGMRKVIFRAGILKPRVKVSEVGERAAKRVPAEEDLRRMYLVDGMTDASIGRECGVRNVTVAAWRRKYGIKRSIHDNAVDLPIDELKRMYVDQKMTMESIANHFGCGESTVRAHVIHNGLAIDSKEVAERRLANNRKRYTYNYVNQGYKTIQVVGHPNANSEGYIGEHRYVAEQAMGRHIEVGEQVHHINLDKLDNRVENLSVLRHAEHSRTHKYMERVAVYILGLTEKRPEPVVFGRDVFWGGKWVSEIDLVADYEMANGFIGQKSDVGSMALVN